METERNENIIVTRKLWRPTPLDPPAPNSQLQSPNPIIRSAEVLRFSVLRLEYWLSPTGHLRQWLRVNLCLAITIGIPAILIFPPVVWLLNGIAAVVALILDLVKTLALIACYSLLLFAGLQFWLVIRSRSNHRPSGRQY